MEDHRPPPLPPPLRSGALRARIRRVSDRALRLGILQSIETSETVVSQAGIDFPIRIAQNVERTAKAAETKLDLHDPFLPPDPDLVVAGVSDSHVAVLNKFNVVPEHLLIVTREFESQTSAITKADFAAWCRCLAEFPSLGFYNSGRIAGASQSHRHLQQVPLPFSEKVPALPIQRLIETDQVPFRHHLHRFTEDETGTPDAWAKPAFSAYRRSLDRLAIEIAEDGEIAQPYNLLLTREWLLLAPRTRESPEGISINGLGIAGSFFVSRPTDAALIRKLGAMRLLRLSGAPR